MPAPCCLDLWERLHGSNVPVFTIVGYDKLAIEVVEYWISKAKEAGVNKGKIIRATEHLEDIKRYQLEYPDKVKLPD